MFLWGEKKVLLVQVTLRQRPQHVNDPNHYLDFTQDSGSSTLLGHWSGWCNCFVELT